MSAVLLKAVSSGRSHQVLLLLDSGVDIEQRDECSQTALIRAVFVENARRRSRLMHLLLRRGAQADAVDAAGRTALHWACLYGHEPEVEMLLARQYGDVDVNVGDMNGETPLFHAVSSGSAATVKRMADVLKKVRLSLDVASYAGITPLIQATRLGHDICASILLRAGAMVGAAVVTTTPTNGARASVLQECLETAERWATLSSSRRGFPPGRPASRENSCLSSSNLSMCNMRSSRERASGGRKGRLRFPPILTQPIAQKIKYRENRAAQLRVHVPVDSDDDSVYSSEVSYYTEESFDLTDHNEFSSPRLGEVAVGGTEHTNKWCRRRSELDMQTISQTSSTENNVSSDDEVHIPSPREKQKADDNSFRSSRDLPDLFRIYEELNSPSFRRGVSGRTSIADSVSSDSGIESPSPASKQNKANKNKTKMQQISELRKMLLRKQTRQAELAYLSTPEVSLTKFHRTPQEGTSGSDTETECHVFNRKMPVLPRILKKAKETNVTPQAVNYSGN